MTRNKQGQSRRILAPAPDVAQRSELVPPQHTEEFRVLDDLARKNALFPGDTPKSIEKVTGVPESIISLWLLQRFLSSQRDRARRVASHRSSKPVSEAALDDIYERYIHGETIKEIADAYKVSERHVYNIFEAHDLPKLPRAERFRARRERNRPHFERLVVEAYQTTGSFAGTVERVGNISERTVKEIIARHLGKDLATWKTTNAPQQWTDDELLAFVKRASDKRSHRGTQLSNVEYSAIRATRPAREWPSVATIMLRFGTWSAALRRAGLLTKEPFERQAHFSDSDIAEAVRACRTMIGRWPTHTEYERWQKQNKETRLPNSRTLTTRFGTWPDVIQKVQSI